MIYTDDCSNIVQKKIKSELNLDVLKRLDSDQWNINDAIRIITEPSISLVVINNLDEISLMEISLLAFLCKPILISSKSITEYPAVIKTVNWIDNSCDITKEYNNFISWYKYTFRRN